MQTPRSRQLQEREWEPRCREARRAPDLKLMRSCHHSLSQPTGLGVQSGDGWATEGLNLLCMPEKQCFLSTHGDSCSMPSSFKYAKDLLPKQFAAISKAHPEKCCLFITRNHSITELDKEEWQFHIVFDFVLNKNSELRP